MMPLDDRAADRQPNTHAAALGCVEGVEYSLQIRRIDADPGILHAQTHTIVSFSPGFDQQMPRAVVHALHRVGGIAEKVQDDLLELDTIAGDGRQVISKFRPQDYPISLKIAQ